MKRKTKKPAKTQKPVQKPLSEAENQKVSMEDLKMRNMRLTREVDRLSTKVASHGTLLFHIHQALMTERIMPYQPVMDAVDPVSNKPKEYPISQKEGKTHGPIIFGNMRGEVKAYRVRAAVQQTSLGYLSESRSWTFDPKQMAMFSTKEELQKALVEAKMPDGAKAVIEEIR